MTSSAIAPLLRRFPALAGLPRAALGRFPTPVAPLEALSPRLWIKRDDLGGEPLGGNKVRALEYLLAGVAPSERVVTVGSAGSTHALAVATYGRRLGATVCVGRWRQEMNPSAQRVADRLEHEFPPGCVPVFRSPLGAYAWAWRHRLFGGRWIAAGGSVPLGILGHVNAGLELVDQIASGSLPEPRCVVVPLGTGGTAAGLALAFAIAQRPIVVIGVRVVPRLVARRRRVLRLAHGTATLIERLSAGQQVPLVRPAAIEVVHHAYGGAYGRETEAARSAAKRLHDLQPGHLDLDATYSAKAFAVALERASREETLFWLTFDPRSLSAP